MKKLKEEKGITLVALIITIVVLLILAMVAIGAVQDSNIIAHSQNAASVYNKEKENENNTITDMEALLDKYATNKPTVPKLSAEEKEELLNLLLEYADNKYANQGSPTEEQLAIANRAKAELLAKGLNVDEAINVQREEDVPDDYQFYAYTYFHDKKILLISALDYNFENIDFVREVTLEEIGVFEELYIRAKHVDEKLDLNEFNIEDYNYYFDYNDESLEFFPMAGSYHYEYSGYMLEARVFDIGGRCLGF